MSLPLVHIYGDGSCSPNPGGGGWGAVLLMPGNTAYRKEISGAAEEATNNRMELTAALMALRALKRPCQVTVHTDSRYVRDAFEAGWIARWQSNGWRTSAKKPVSNADLWRELIEVAAVHQVTWQWVKGHADNVENNRCDELANEARIQGGFEV